MGLLSLGGLLLAHSFAGIMRIAYFLLELGDKKGGLLGLEFLLGVVAHMDNKIVVVIFGEDAA